MNKAKAHKTHLVEMDQRTGEPELRTRCGIDADQARSSVIGNRSNADIMKSVTCHWCRWGRSR